MIDPRPVLLGMNNPHSTDPRSALLPAPRNSAGWRLWKMCHDLCGVSRFEWLRVFERRNLLDARMWDPHAARRRVEQEELWSWLQGRRVLLMGQSVRQCLRLRPSAPLIWREHTGVTWCYVPHPSGLNRDYNDPTLRAAVGMRLEQLYHDSRELVRSGVWG